MTNRFDDYLDYNPPVTKADEIEWLADFLAATDKPLTVENAQAALVEFRLNAPGAWLLTVEDVPGLWAERMKVAVTN